MGDTVIQVDNLWKEYRLGTINHHTLTRDLQSWWARVLGKEDPNSLVGSTTKQPSKERFWALQDVSFEVKQGNVLGIIGRNGAGKSTLLKILSQVTAPTKGEIRLKGRIASLLEVGTGFHPDLTGRENVFLNGAILGMSKSDILRRLDEIIEFAEIGKFVDTPVKRYSSGMYVRLAFAVAAHLEPEILVVDEVLAVGDAQFQKKCLGKMEDVGKQGRTILFVSHNMVAVRNLCSSGMMLASGEIVSCGTIDNVVDAYLQLKAAAGPDGRLVVANEALGISLAKIDFVDDKGKVTEALRVGLKGSIRLWFEAASSLKNVIASISVNTLDGVRVCVLHTGISSNCSIDMNPPSGCLLCELAKIPFLPGVYRLHIKVAHSNGDVIFYIPYARELTVEGGDFFGTGRLPETTWGGIHLVEHSWKVESKL